MTNLYLYTPELILAISAPLLLLREAFWSRASKEITFYAAFIATLFALLLLFCPKFAIIGVQENSGFLAAIFSDSLALAARRLILASLLLSLLMSKFYTPMILRFTIAPEAKANTEDKKNEPCALGEFYILQIIATLGLLAMVLSRDFVTLFVAIELAAVSFYILSSYFRLRGSSLEAGAKYLILGGISASFLVLAIAWLYGVSGAMNFDQLREAFSDSVFVEENKMVLLFCFVLLFCALAFKVGAFPFHFWIPDVYQGAPTPISALLASSSKIASFVVLARFTEPFLNAPALSEKILAILVGVALFSIFVANFGAFAQNNIKRMLAYSSVAHSGMLLLIIVASNNPEPLIAPRVLNFYLAAYMIATFSAFLVLSAVSREFGDEDIDSFAKLGQDQSLLRVAMLIAMASLAGIPFSVGFLAKFYLFRMLLANGEMLVFLLALIGVIISFYYYFRVIAKMYWRTNFSEVSEKSVKVSLPLYVKICLVILSAASVFFGIFPEPLMRIYP